MSGMRDDPSNEGAEEVPEGRPASGNTEFSVTPDAAAKRVCFRATEKLPPGQTVEMRWLLLTPDARALGALLLAVADEVEGKS